MNRNINQPDLDALKLRIRDSDYLASAIGILADLLSERIIEKEYGPDTIVLPNEEHISEGHVGI